MNKQASIARPIVVFALLAMLAGWTGCAAKPAAGASDELLRAAQTYIRQGNYPAAFAHLDRALQLAPNDPAIHRNLAWAALYTDQPLKATEELKKLNALEPDSPHTEYLTGALYDYLGQTKTAIRHYRQALAQLPDDPQLRYDLGTALNNLDVYAEALPQFEAGLKLLKPKDVNRRTNFLFSICSTQYALDDLDKALASCREAVRLSDDPEEKERITDMMETMKLVQKLKHTPASELESAGNETDAPDAH